MLVLVNDLVFIGKCCLNVLKFCILIVILFILKFKIWLLKLWLLFVKWIWKFVELILWNNFGVKKFMIEFLIFLCVFLGCLWVELIKCVYGGFWLGIICICIFLNVFEILIVENIFLFFICFLILLNIFFWFLLDVLKFEFVLNFVIVVYGVILLFVNFINFLCLFVW